MPSHVLVENFPPGDPVQGCKMCKVYARPGMHIYRCKSNSFGHGLSFVKGYSHGDTHGSRGRGWQQSWNGKPKC